MALVEVMSLKGDIGKLQGKLQNDQLCVSDLYQITDELKTAVTGPLKDSVGNEDNVNVEDACMLLFEVIAACFDLVRAVLGKIEELEEGTVIPNLKNKLESTNDEIKRLKQQLEKLSKENEQKLEEQRKKHESQNKKMRSDFDARFERMEQEQRRLNDKITRNEKRHKEEVAALNEKIEKLTCNELTLMVGQLPFEIEKEIIETVLHDCTVPQHHIYHLDEMIDALTGKGTYIDIFKRDDKDDGTTNLRKANEAWTKLQAKLGWKREHSYAMRAVKSLRRSIAHPPFDFQVVVDTVAKGTVKEIESAKKSYCQELIKLYRQLKSP